MSETLTKAKIERALAIGVPSGKASFMLWDANPVGLGLKLRQSGSASWIYTYRPKGSGRATAARTMTIGPWPGVTLESARKAAQAHAGHVALGQDPAVELRHKRKAARRLVSSCIDDFEADMNRRRLVNAKTITSTLKRGLASLSARDITEISRRDVVDQVTKLIEAGKPGAAADLRRHARTFLEWAVTHGYREFNPMAGLRLPKTSRAERLEDGRRIGRALADEEVHRVWSTTASASPFHGLVRLALLTGLRRSELAGLRWSDIKQDRLVIPAERTKTGITHEVPLTPPMTNVLQSQHRTTNPLVFVSGRRTGGTKISGWSKLLPKVVKASGVDFTLHDLRRTARTNLSRLGVAEDVAELCIGHVRRGLLGTYNKDHAWAARVTAFKSLSKHVMKVVG